MELVIRHGGTEAQFKFWQSDAKYRAFVGGVGSGKTRAGVVEILRMPPESVGIMVSPTYPMLRDTVLPVFREVCGTAILTFNKESMTCELINGTTVLFRSATDPDVLRGINAGWFWLDEAALQPRIIWDILVGRLRHPVGPHRGWITTTPRGLNWVWSKWCKSNSPHFELFQTTSAANHFLPPGFVDDLMREYSGKFMEQEVGGQFVAWADVPAYSEFLTSRNVVPDTKDRYSPYRPLILCVDVNVALLAWPVCQVIDDRVYVIDEVCVRDTSLAAAVRQFREKYPAHRGGVRIYGDATAQARKAQTGKSDYDIIMAAFNNYASRVELRVPTANPPPRDRINAVNNMLCPNSGDPRVFIDPSAERLILDLQTVEWNETGTDVMKAGRKDSEKYLLTHASDAFGYFIYADYPLGTVRVQKQDLAPTSYEPLHYERMIGDY